MMEAPATVAILQICGIAVVVAVVSARVSEWCCLESSPFHDSLCTRHCIQIVLQHTVILLAK